MAHAGLIAREKDYQERLVLIANADENNIDVLAKFKAFSAERLAMASD